MEKYIFFEKTADAKFQAFGPTLEEAFKNAQEAMISIMFSPQEIVDYEFDRGDREINVEGANYESLLYNFLEETIFLLSAESFIGLVTRINIREVEGTYRLKALIEGTQSINLESHNEVKAVTYNEMFVKYDDARQEYVVQVVVDL
jgi:SHS2 domain-containing protein